MKCSVILVAHYRPDWFIGALRSLFYQTSKDFEIIVVNDVPFCQEEITRIYGLPDRTTYIKYKKGVLLGGARNIGLRMAEGEYIICLDDDDVFYPDHIDRLIKCLDSNPAVDLAYTDYNKQFHREDEGRRWVHAKDRIPCKCGEFSIHRMMGGNFIPVCCIMFRKKLINDVGMFDDAVESHEDWDLWARMTHANKVWKYLPGHTCEVSWRGNTMTSNGEIMNGGRKKVIEKIRKLRS